MKISEINLKSETNGIQPLHYKALGDVVILTGGNGSGKTRLLKAVENHVKNLKHGTNDGKIELQVCQKNVPNAKEEALTTSNANVIEIINYSHYDAYLQSPQKFTPYVIQKAQQILQTCDYQETALNSLLLLDDMVQGYSPEFKDRTCFNNFKNNVAKKFNIDLSIKETDTKVELELFNRSIEDAFLSPGQQYLLRMSVACYQNHAKDNLIFFLDEPELHLHPKALIDIICYLRDTFKQSQFWISTHSLPLIAYLTTCKENITVINMKNGKSDLFRSDSTDLIDGLIGGEDNYVALQTILATPEEYACNKFSIECYNSSETLSANPNDPQNELVAQILKPQDMVIDYGAGKGRFFEGLAIDYASTELAKNITYYAYDHSPDDSEKCKFIMQQYGANPKNYYNDIDELIKKVKGNADYVLLVNVLHEIDPLFWQEIFQNVKSLLKASGKLIIVERSELTIGEAPYNNRFLVITQNSANQLFGKKNVERSTYPGKKHIEKYTVSFEGLDINKTKLTNCIKHIKNDAFKKIQLLKAETNHEKGYKKGLKLAFWLNQYANSTFSLQELK